MHGAIHNEQARVWLGSSMALLVSFTNLEQTLRIAVLFVTLVYGLLKLWKAFKPKAPINLNDSDPPIKL